MRRGDIIVGKTADSTETLQKSFEEVRNKSDGESDQVSFLNMYFIAAYHHHGICKVRMVHDWIPDHSSVMHIASVARLHLLDPVVRLPSS